MNTKAARRFQSLGPDDIGSQDGGRGKVHPTDSPALPVLVHWCSFVVSCCIVTVKWALLDRAAPVSKRTNPKMRRRRRHYNREDCFPENFWADTSHSQGVNR